MPPMTPCTTMTFPDLSIPTKEPVDKPEKVLYVVESLAREFHYGKKILRKVPIVWYYADIRKRALVDCQKSVWGGFMHRNDFGVKVPSGTLFTDFR
jgi:hypothetical protein